MNKLTGKKFEFLPKIPKENEMLCPTCDGIGWLESEEGYIQRCRDCCDGIIDLCPNCGKPMHGMCMNEECRAKHEAEQEKLRYDKAQKYTDETAPSESKIMFYSDVYEYNEGYFSEIRNLVDYCHDEGIKVPDYVWGTHETQISLDAHDIIEDACEELWEGAYDSIGSKDIAELEVFLDNWCANQTGTRTYTVDYSCCILIK